MPSANRGLRGLSLLTLPFLAACEGGLNLGNLFGGGGDGGSSSGATDQTVIIVVAIAAIAVVLVAVSRRGG